MAFNKYFSWLPFNTLCLLNVDGYHTVLNLNNPNMMHNVYGIYIIFSCNVGGNVDLFFLSPLVKVYELVKL